MFTKRRFLIAISLSGLLTFMGLEQVFTNIAQPLPGYTGAPGELTCNTAGCHTGNNLATNVSTITLAPFGSPSISNGIQANTQYIMTLNLNVGSGYPTYGFEMTAVDENGNGAGTFTTTTPAFSTVQSANGKSYLTHGGTNGASSTTAYGLKWTSPATVPAEVNFYIVANYANNDGTNQGDQIVQRIYKATTAGFFTVGIESVDIDKLSEINIFPNPAVDHVNVEFFADQSTNISVELFDLQGKKLQTLLESPASMGNNSFQANIDQNLGTGLYLVKVNTENNSYFKKLFIQ